MVLKPSELTPFTALELGDIANQVGLPAGVSNNVTGFGSEAGQSLTDHPGGGQTGIYRSDSHWSTDHGNGDTGH